jgi:hypothetical protein
MHVFQLISSVFTAKILCVFLISPNMCYVKIVKRMVATVPATLIFRLCDCNVLPPGKVTPIATE